MLRKAAALRGKGTPPEHRGKENRSVQKPRIPIQYDFSIQGKHPGLLLAILAPLLTLGRDTEPWQKNNPVSAFVTSKGGGPEWNSLGLCHSAGLLLFLQSIPTTLECRMCQNVKKNSLLLYDDTHLKLQHRKGDCILRGSNNGETHACYTLPKSSSRLREPLGSLPLVAPLLPRKAGSEPNHFSNNFGRKLIMGNIQGMAHGKKLRCHTCHLAASAIPPGKTSRQDFTATLIGDAGICWVLLLGSVLRLSSGRRALQNVQV